MDRGDEGNASSRASAGHGLITEHLDYLAHLGRRPGTIKHRRWCLLRFQRFLAGASLLDANYQDLSRFVARDGTRGPEARCTEISHLRSFYAWALDQELIDTNPASRLRRPSRPRRLPRPMPNEALARALNGAPDPIRVWLHLAAYAGLRCCEIAPLRGEDYQPAAGLLELREMKGGDAGTVAVSPHLAAVLDRLPPAGTWFPRWDGQPGAISAGQLQKHANRWLHAQGIKHTMHTARHWFGTHIFRASGRDLRLTQEALRHKSVATTAIYTHIDQAELVSIIARLSEFVPGEEVA